MKIYRLLMLVLVLLLLSGLVAWAADSTDDEYDPVEIPITTMIIAPPDGVEAKKLSVSFPHPAHFDYSCKTCHHAWDGYEQISPCMDCHDSTTAISRKAPKEEYIQFYQAAYHEQCRDCHKKIGMENKKIKKANLKKAENEQQPLLPNGPKTCNTCHAVTPTE